MESENNGITLKDLLEDYLDHAWHRNSQNEKKYSTQKHEYVLLTTKIQ